MYLLGIAGYSGGGKTTLIEKLLPLLRARGLRIAVIKHTHHDVDWDVPGKDSHRHRSAGACQVLLAAGKRRMLVEELDGSNDLPLSAHVAMLAPCDLVLAEGFKHEAVPKIEVINSALDSPRLYPVDGQVLAVVSDADVQTELPRFHRDDADAIVRFVLSLLENHHADL